jgi:hypothetical protein
MSDKVLPLLYADLPKVEAQMAHHRENRVRWVEHLDPATFRADLDRKRERFLMRYADQDWRSWTLADQRTFEALKAQHLASWSTPAAATAASMQAAMEAVVAEAEPDVSVVEPEVEAEAEGVEARVVEEPNTR